MLQGPSPTQPSSHAEQTVPPLEPLPATTAALPSKGGAATGQLISNAADSQGTSTAANPQPEVHGPAAQTVPPLEPLPAQAEAVSSPALSASNVLPPSAETDSQAEGNEAVVQGQTIAQVKAILGEPERIADLGSRVIYVYPHSFKVSFVDGKVSAVQQLESNQ